MTMHTYESLTKLSQGRMLLRCCSLFFILYTLFLSGAFVILGYFAMTHGSIEMTLVRPYVNRHLSIALMATGCLLFLAVIVSYCSLAKRNNLSLALTCIILFLAMVITLTCAGVTHRMDNSNNGTFSEELQLDLVDKFSQDPEFTKLWDKVQFREQCCGVYGPQDYTGSKFEEKKLGVVPESCCVKRRESFVDLNRCLKNATFPSTSTNTVGCEERIIHHYSLMLKVAYILFYVFSFLIFLAIIAIIANSLVC